jgi:MFS family permease
MHARPTRTASEELSAMVLALIATVVCAAPIFLTGALSPLIGADLGFGSASLGLAASAFFIASASFSLASGRIFERVGARNGAILGLAATVVAVVGLAAAPRFAVFSSALVLAGVGNGLLQPSANLILLRFVSSARMGVAFGLKQAAIPLAALASGLAIPAFAIRLGWRPTYVIFALITVVILIALRSMVAPMPPDSDALTDSRGRRSDAGSGAAHGRVPLRRVIDREIARALVVGFLAAGGVASLAVFLVRDLVRLGLGLGTAGSLLAVGSIIGALSRLGAGILEDRRLRLRGLRLVRLMIALGGAGLLMMASGLLPVVMLGTFVAFAAGWGWNGVYHLSYLRLLTPESRDRLAGLAQSSVFLGGAVGPLAFGSVAERSFPLAWAVSGACLVVGAAIPSGRPGQGT